MVIVSGGGARTPFTTPTEACSDAEGFLTAGNTATGLRDYLLAQGKQVYTAPTMEEFGPVADPPADSYQPFKDCPTVLPETLTITSSGDIGWGGERLARFVQYLHDQYGVTDVDFDDWWVDYANKGDKGINREDTTKYLDGPGGWNSSQTGALDGIPVTLLTGTMFEADGGDPTVWPYDGVVSQYSGWAVGVDDAVIPWRACWAGPLTHSIFLSDAYNVWATQKAGPGPLTPQPPLDWQTGITWNTDALARVNQAIDNADTALTTPNRQGCP